MFAASKTAAVSGAGPDDKFNYVTMLLHGDGTNGAQNNTFLDSSTNNFTITRNGNTTQGSFSPYGSNWSNYFDGTGDYLTTSSSQIIPTGSFTVECFVFITGSGNNQKFVSQGTSGTAGRFSVGIEGGNWWVQLGSDAVQTGTPVRNQWNYVAATFNGSTLSIYVNGSLISSVSTSTNAQNTTLTIGQDWNSYTTTGYISNVRVSNTVRTVTTVPTAPFTSDGNTRLLACQANRFLDSSANAFALTVNGNTSVQRFNPFGASTAYSTSVIGGSGYFDGSGDYIKTTGTVGIANSAFTICCWFYPLNSSVIGLFDSGPGRGDVFRNYDVNLIEFQGGGTSVSIAGDYKVNAWNWLCITKSSTTFDVYINGASAGSGTCGATMVEDKFTIGTINNGGDGSYLGYISDFQVLNTATVVSIPTAPIANASGKTYLLNFTNGAIFDNAMMNNLETVGNAQISTSVKKYGTGSISLSASGNTLRTQYNNPSLSIGTGNFTIEGWVYFSSTPSTNGVFQMSGTSGGFAPNQTANLALATNNSTSWQIYAKNTFTISSSTGISVGSWIHFALVRSGTTTVLYINGTALITLTSDSTNYSTPYIGLGAIYDATSYPLGGYIDDLRITNGFARYTANFTAPTAAFSDTGPY
jgi:hypothetical protein